MKTFKFIMVETRDVEVLYEVEADDLFEAEKLANRGETVSEKPIRVLAVNNRRIRSSWP